MFSINKYSGVMNFGIAPTILNNKVWADAGNDGLGSGLDADKVDGINLLHF